MYPENSYKYTYIYIYIYIYNLYPEAVIDIPVWWKPETFVAVKPGLQPVQRADVFRYLVLWYQGGYYADTRPRSQRAGLGKW